MESSIPLLKIASIISFESLFLFIASIPASKQFFVIDIILALVVGREFAKVSQAFLRNLILSSPCKFLASYPAKAIPIATAK